MEILRSMIPKLVTDAFREVEGGARSGSRRTRRGSCIRIFGPTRRRHRDSVRRRGRARNFGHQAPQALDRDIGEDCEIELMFTSINAVVLRLQRFGSIIDAMRDVGVSNAKMRVCAREQRHRYLIHADNGSGGS